jgi:hypothetical protein
MQQLSLFDVMHEPPIRQPVDPDGPVVTDGIDEVWELKGRHACAVLARIEVHRDGDGGYFMWAISHPNGGYRVGPKWGRFAVTAYDARFYAARELIDYVSARPGPETQAVIAWAMQVADMSDRDLRTTVAP